MAYFSRLEVAKTMMDEGLVPLFYHSDIELCKEVMRACFRGGTRLLEFTNRGAFAHEVFAELARFAQRDLPGFIIGAGSVIDAGTASMYLQLGANFIVSPMLVEEVAVVCNRRKVLWTPGCGSLTEINQAHELGAEIIKLFPAGVYGPGFIKDSLGPCPWLKIMPTGGVTPSEDNLQSWFQAGAACVGMGSQLISKDILANRDMEALEDKVRRVLKVIQKVRG
jgi:2-dehydro-3-deoxyphosphogluconate aldolase / (4S)-4-hydroxy-2-oxoglutarate aldolase